MISRLRPMGLWAAGPPVAFLLVAGCTPEPPPPPAPPQVTVETPTQRDVTIFQDFTGNIAATESVEIRARVQGFLEKYTFRAGSFVKKGQLLFVIEQAPYAAARDQAEAEVRASEASVRRAESDLDRLEQAVKTNAVSQQEVTRARAERDQARAALASAGARLDTATINLDYTAIHSPIDGVISRRLVDPGNLVGRTDATRLANVSAIDPVYVYFEVNEQLVASFLGRWGGYKDTDSRESPDDHLVFVSLDGIERVFEGRLDYIDPAADPDTGTLQMRAIVPNEDRGLLPGFFVRIRVPGEIIAGALLVPETALTTDLGGRYLMLVDDQGLAQKRYVKTGPLEDDQMRVILEGLEIGERFIARGLQRARPGMPVSVGSN